ncbi:MAG: hypothetical protein CL933_13645 [Deltaproteobacteria bacterium]|nr:hypothetical protein [Deltaproteobacteria bacterium]
MGLVVPIGAPLEELMEAAAKRIGLSREELLGFKIARRSVDLRGQRGGREPRFVVHADCTCPAEHGGKALNRSIRSGKVVEAPVSQPLTPARIVGKPPRRIVVVGSGPAGTFAALPLALSGCEVTVLDRGGPLEERGRDLAAFHRGRVPNPESNLLFGEGGAGTYSDGKLYTRSDDPLEAAVLNELVAAGAPEEIFFDSRAHVGTDKLHDVLLALRARMEAAGVRFLWRTRMDDLALRHSAEREVEAVLTTQGELACDAVVLATGHSARDSWGQLRERGVEFEAKPFQVGVRIEHPQELIDEGRYGDVGLTSKLGAASYELVAKGVGAHTFCMCPGGRIVASVQGEGVLCTNGMSNSTHSSGWANAAVVGTIRPPVGAAPFWGMALQEELERSAFDAGGGDYTAPAQLASDFMRGEKSSATPHTTYPFGTRPARIDALLPEDLRARLVDGLARFHEQIPGFAGDVGVMVGVETRSSGPVRMSRHPERRTARGFSNLFPVGEGAGYAGGIMTSATDGVRTAHVLLGAHNQDQHE